jgi:hypothetical protein
MKIEQRGSATKLLEEGFSSVLLSSGSFIRRPTPRFQANSYIGSLDTRTTGKEITEGESGDDAVLGRCVFVDAPEMIGKGIERTRDGFAGIARGPGAGDFFALRRGNPFVFKAGFGSAF